MFKFFLSILLMFSMTGCMNQKAVLKPTKFSKETQQVLQLFQDQVAFYSTKVPENARSVEIHLWTLNDGKWNDEMISQGEAKDDDFAMQILDSSIRLIHYDDEGSVSSTINRKPIDIKDMGTAICRVEEPKEIKIGDHIPLWIQIYTRGDHFSVGENFKELDYEAGFAITYVALEEPISD